MNGPVAVLVIGLGAMLAELVVVVIVARWPQRPR